MASPAAASLDLDLENDFEEIQRIDGGDSQNGADVNAYTQIFRPEPHTDISQDRIRVARTVLDISAEGPDHRWARIKMQGKNNTYLDEVNGAAAVGPGNTIGSNSYTIGFNAGVSSGGSAEVGVSASRSVTESNLDIDDKTQPDDDLMKHRYEFSGDMRENRVVVDGTAVFDMLQVDEWDEAIEIDWIVEILTTWEWDPEMTGGGTYTHVEGDLS